MFKIGDKVILSDGSEWTILKVFDTAIIKDQIYHIFNKAQIQYTLGGKYSEILMNEDKLLRELKSNTVHKVI